MSSQNHHRTAATPAMFAALGADTHDRPDGEVVVWGGLSCGLSGVLFRDRTGRFRRGGETIRTVLDGDGVMQRLHIVDGIARYTRRFVQAVDWV